MSVWHYTQSEGTGKRFNVDQREYEESPCQRRMVSGRLCGRPATTKLQAGGRHDYYCDRCVAQLIVKSGAILTKITDE